MWINILGQVMKPRVTWDTNCSWVTRSRWERNKGHCHFSFSHSWSKGPSTHLLKATRSLPTTVPPAYLWIRDVLTPCWSFLATYPLVDLFGEWDFHYNLSLSFFSLFSYRTVLEFLSLLSLFAFWNADIDIEVLVEKYHWHVICLPFQTDPNLSVPNYSKACTVWYSLSFPQQSWFFILRD